METEAKMKMTLKAYIWKGSIEPLNQSIQIDRNKGTTKYISE